MSINYYEYLDEKEYEADEKRRKPKSVKWRRPPKADKHGEPKRHMRDQARYIEKEIKEQAEYEQKVFTTLCGNASMSFADNSKIENPQPRLSAKSKASEEKALDVEPTFAERMESYKDFLGLKFTPESEEILKFFTDPRSVPRGGEYYMKDEYIDGVFKLQEIILNKSVLFVFKSIESGFSTTYTPITLRGLDFFQKK